MFNKIIPTKILNLFDLIRLNKPIGFMLLMWPSWFALAYIPISSLELIIWYIYFFVGAFLMRSAGCIINDLVDIKIDNKILRTADRPLTSKKITKTESIIFLLFLLFLSLIILLQFKLNSILIGFTQDIWSYISKGYFTQKNISGEIGSSTMPHKINPINFENAEGNLGMSNSLSHFFANKLTISRLQRDLSDSTVLRNLGLTFAYSIIAYKNILIGLNKLDINKDNINKDIDNSWEILAEPIQMVARKHHIPDSYEYLKKYTRGEKVNQEIILKIINSLNIPESEKNNLAKLTPRKYIGYASELCDE